MGQDATILVFWMLSFKPAFSLSSFTLIKRFFSCSLLAAVRVVSSTYLRLLIFLLAVLTPPWASSSSAFHMMYSAYKLKKQGDDIQLWPTLSQFGPARRSMSGSNCCLLSSIQVSQEPGKLVWYSHLFQNFPQCAVIHTVKGFGVVKKTEMYV